MKREFQVIIEKDQDGYFVSEVVGLRGCHTQAKTLDELISRTKEAIELYLEVSPIEYYNEYIGVQKLQLEY